MWFVCRVTLDLHFVPTQDVRLVKGAGLKERWRHLLLMLLGSLKMCGLFKAALESNAHQIAAHNVLYPSYTFVCWQDVMLYKYEDFDLLIFVPNFHLSHAIQLTFFSNECMGWTMCRCQYSTAFDLQKWFFYAVQFNWMNRWTLNSFFHRNSILIKNETNLKQHYLYFV